MLARSVVTVLAGAALTATGASLSVAKSQLTARFLGTETYATMENCKKAQAIADGGPVRLDTVPNLLNAQGFRGWENGCVFTSVKEREKGRVWITNLDCMTGGRSWKESDTFTRLPDGSFDVAAKNATTRYLRCDVHGKL